MSKNIEILFLQINQLYLNFVINEWNNLKHELHIFNWYFWERIENSRSEWQKSIPWGIKTSIVCPQFILVSKFESLRKIETWACCLGTASKICQTFGAWCYKPKFVVSLVSTSLNAPFGIVNSLLKVNVSIRHAFATLHLN